jgi:hypothetical protein
MAILFCWPKTKVEPMQNRSVQKLTVKQNFGPKHVRTYQLPGEFDIFTILNRHLEASGSDWDGVEGEEMGNAVPLGWGSLHC